MEKFGTKQSVRLSRRTLDDDGDDKVNNENDCSSQELRGNPWPWITVSNLPLQILHDEDEDEDEEDDESDYNNED